MRKKLNRLRNVYQKFKTCSSFCRYFFDKYADKCLDYSCMTGLDDLPGLYEWPKDYRERKPYSCNYLNPYCAQCIGFRDCEGIYSVSISYDEPDCFRW